MNLSSFSQTGYPKKIIYDSDTLVAITSDQLTTINLVHIEKQRHVLLSDSLTVIVEKCDTIIGSQEKMIYSLGIQIQFKDSIQTDLGVIIGQKDLIIDQHEGTIKKLKRQKAVAIIIGVVGTVFGIVAVL